MKFINFDNIVSKDDENYINKNVFVPQHFSIQLSLVKRVGQRQAYYSIYQH